MKNLIVLFAPLMAALLITGCASKPPAGPSANDMLADAKGKAPAGTIVGQAIVKGSKDSSAQSRAEQSALSQIKRGLTYIASEMIDEQAAAGGLTASVATELKQNVSTALSRATLENTVKVESGADGAFVAYAVYYIDKGEALKEFTKAVNAAKEVVSARNFNTNTFDATFAKAAAREWKN
jgi:hypothetical protein